MDRLTPPPLSTYLRTCKLRIEINECTRVRYVYGRSIDFCSISLLLRRGYRGKGGKKKNSHKKNAVKKLNSKSLYDSAPLQSRINLERAHILAYMNPGFNRENVSAGEGRSGDIITLLLLLQVI